jgi:hypothetical protein
MTYCSELNFYGPMQPAVWETTDQPRSQGYLIFEGKGRTRVEATMAAISFMKSQINPGMSPQCTEWIEHILIQLHLKTLDTKWVEGHAEHGTFVYATISIGPVPNGVMG